MPELEPLAAFHPLPRIESVAAAAIPAPYRELLDHQQDMTSTLERFHKGRISLRVLQSQRDQHQYGREVVLVLDGTNTAVEYGAIQIALDAFDPEGQKQIIAGRRPLGAILAERRMSYFSRPITFLCVESDERMKLSLGLSDSCTLFGRCNRFTDPKGRQFASIVEILPPLAVS